MLHPETLEAYRRMTVGERLQLTLEMTAANTPYLFVGTPEQLDEDYMRTWAVELGVEDRLRDAIAQFHKDNSGDQT